MITQFLILAVTAGMLTEENSAVINEVTLKRDLVVCGGGLAGVCASIAAARHGTEVVLIQDRPMLGGNASSEMRMGICGALGENNKEAGILEELQLENIYLNPLMRYTLWDDIIMSAVRKEKNITLLLNTSVNDVVMKDGKIAAVKAWNSNAYTRYTIEGRLFADCTGDGILRISGAKFRRGREFPEEFGETYLQQGGDAKTMGNSILMQLRKTTVHRPFKAPAWAHKFTDEDFPNVESTEKFQKNGVGYSFKRAQPTNGKGGYNNFWWIEYGGNIDTVRDANAIQFELKKIAYGVWEYMKNHPDGRCKDFELDWIGSLPGKRESTRFVGPHIFTQHDAMSGGKFTDVVAYGGWPLDDHHPDAFYNKGYMALQHKVPGIFGIPFRCLYSVNIPNLVFAGRDISCTHIGLSSLRVMGTTASLGQAVGTAAALILKYDCTPDELDKRHIGELQAMLEDDDCMLPGRWRKVSKLTEECEVKLKLKRKVEVEEGGEGEGEGEVLKNGIDRNYDGKDNGVWLGAGEAITYRWKEAKTISGVRMVFDSIMQCQNVYDKRMRKLEATTEYEKLPPPLVKAFVLEAEANGKWVKIAEDEENHQRLRRLYFPLVEATALRFTVKSAWGGEKAHVFAMDALGEREGESKSKSKSKARVEGEGEGEGGVTTEAFTEEVKRVLPVEAEYEYHRWLESAPVHEKIAGEGGRRRWNAVPTILYIKKERERLSRRRSMIFKTSSRSRSELRPRSRRRHRSRVGRS